MNGDENGEDEDRGEGHDTAKSLSDLVMGKQFVMFYMLEDVGGTSREGCKKVPDYLCYKRSLSLSIFSIKFNICIYFKFQIFIYITHPLIQ